MPTKLVLAKVLEKLTGEVLVQIKAVSHVVGNHCWGIDLTRLFRHHCLTSLG